MKTNIANNPKIKLILGITIPVLVMIVTICMVGMSFAWFSMSNEVYVESISIVTEAAYTIEFGVDGTNDNVAYRGQYAISKSGSTLSLADDEDAPFYFIKTVQLSSQGIEIDYSVSIDSLFIRTVDDNNTDDATDDIVQVRNTYNLDDARLNTILGSNPDNPTYQDLRQDSDKRVKEDIPFVFTWFFRQSTAQGDNTTYPDNYNDDDKTMLDIAPANNGEVWYTPYGKIEWTSATEYSVSSLDDTYKKAILGNADGSALNYDFFIIFAPEALFWKQYFDITVSYTDEQLSHILGNQLNQIYYSSFDYQGAIFDFSVMFDVTKLYEEDATA